MIFTHCPKSAFGHTEIFWKTLGFNRGVYSVILLEHSPRNRRRTHCSFYPISQRFFWQIYLEMFFTARIHPRSLTVQYKSVQKKKTQREFVRLRGTNPFNQLHAPLVSIYIYLYIYIYDMYNNLRDTMSHAHFFPFVTLCRGFLFVFFIFFITRSGFLRTFVISPPDSYI